MRLSSRNLSSDFEETIVRTYHEFPALLLELLLEDGVVVLVAGELPAEEAEHDAVEHAGLVAEEEGLVAQDVGGGREVVQADLLDLLLGVAADAL